MKMRYAGLVVCMWCVLCGQETPKNQHSPASTASNHASDSAKIVPPPSTVVNPSVAAPQSQPAAANAQQQTQTDPSIWFLRPEWVIVWVTLVYTILTYFTLRTIKRQADLMGDQLTDARKDSADSAKTTAETLKAMQEQAKFLLLQANHMVDHKLVMIESLNAARKSVNAVIGAERPWIVPSVRQIEPGVYVYLVKNEGKTPAKVQSVYCANLWQPHLDMLHIPPDESTGETQLQNPPFLLPPGAERSIWRLERSAVEKMSGGGEGEQSGFMRGFGSSRTFGRILYWDLLDDDDPDHLHETRFLYLLIPQAGTIPIPDPFWPEHNTYS